MLRFVILIDRAPAASGNPFPHPSDDRPWVSPWRSERACVWLAESTTKLQGRPTGAGYSIGVADEAGSRVAVEQLPAGRIAVFRDAGGAIPAIHTTSPGYHVVCSHPEDLRRYAGDDIEIDWSYVSHFLLNDYLAPRRTALRGVEELLPGERLVIDGSEVQVRADWTPAACYRDPIRDKATAMAELRAAAERSADAWARPYRRVTLDLSGGLDSASMLGLLRRTKSAAEVLCLNYSNAHAESDELRYARACAERYGVQLIEVSGDRAITDLRQSPPPLLPRPSIMLARIGFDARAKEICRDLNAEAFFTGRGGDHLFGASVGVLYPSDYLRTRRDPLGWVRHAYQAAKMSGTPLATVLRGGLSRRKGLAEVLGTLGFKNQFALRPPLDAEEFARFAHPWLLEAIEHAPPARLRQVIDIIELQRHFMRFGRAEVADEAHPFISPLMLTASLRTANYLYPLGGMKRGLQREVFKDLIPEGVYSRRTKGGTTSHVAHTIQANLAHIRALLLEGSLAANGLVDRDLLDRKLSAVALLEARFVSELVVVMAAQTWANTAEAFLRSRRREIPSPDPSETRIAAA
jgi:asparagine synthase (glutamine-hydrolysing)